MSLGKGNIIHKYNRYNIILGREQVKNGKIMCRGEGDRILQDKLSKK